MKKKTKKTKPTGVPMLMIRCNMDDFPVSIANAADDDWRDLKHWFERFKADQSDANLELLQCSATKLVERMLLGWSVWDVTGLIKASRVVWAADTQPIEIETIPLDGHIDDLLPSERRKAAAK